MPAIHNCRWSRHPWRICPNTRFSKFKLHAFTAQTPAVRFPHTAAAGPRPVTAQEKSQQGQEWWRGRLDAVPAGDAQPGVAAKVLGAGDPSGVGTPPAVRAVSVCVRVCVCVCERERERERERENSGTEREWLYFADAAVGGCCLCSSYLARVCVCEVRLLRQRECCCLSSALLLLYSGGCYFFARVRRGGG